MNTKFDELTKSLAQSVTRRAALKKFGVGLAGMALACFGQASKARAATHQGYCTISPISVFSGDPRYDGGCVDINGCVWSSSSDCPAGTSAGNTNKNGGGGLKSACGRPYKSIKCSFTV